MQFVSQKTVKIPQVQYTDNRINAAPDAKQRQTPANQTSQQLLEVFPDSISGSSGKSNSCVATPSTNRHTTTEKVLRQGRQHSSVGKPLRGGAQRTLSEEERQTCKRRGQTKCAGVTQSQPRVPVTM